MLTKNRTIRQFLSSRALSAAIVGGVVLINSVAWGIPLLVGGGQTASAVVGSNIKTGTISRPAGDHPTAVEQAVLRAPKAFMPLPHRAPGRALKSNQQISGVGNRRLMLLPPLPTARLSATRPWQSRQPKTLFPRPVAPPNQLSAAVAAKPSGSATEPRRAPLRKSVRDVVLVSPYTPGVRVVPNGRGHQWRHRNLHASSGATTLDRARAIARRASLRFEQMRARLAGLDDRRVIASNDTRTHGRAPLPVAARPPRIVDGAVGHNATKSAYSHIRTRLVRRPLSRVATPPQESAAVSSAPTPATMHNRPTVRAASVPGAADVGAPPPTQVARLAPKAAIRSPRRAQARLLRAKRASLRSKRNRFTRRRATKLRKARRRHAPRKINGFRRDFHRQLVAANFFGGNR